MVNICLHCNDIIPLFAHFYVVLYWKKTTCRYRRVCSRFTVVEHKSAVVQSPDHGYISLTSLEKNEYATGNL